VCLDYVEWFAVQTSLQIVPGEIVSLNRSVGGNGRFLATLGSGDTVTARNVVVAIGFANFAHVPPEMADRLPAKRFDHTCTAVDLDVLAGHRCLIVGGRQSAFEWAAGGVRLWPRREVASTQLTATDAIAVRFQSGEVIEVDRVILATGYRPNIRLVPPR
jgi:lysine/ornithine N-monooxygenase